MTLPQPKSVLLCGHSKCGTRWLTSVLETNPHVRVVDMRIIVPDNEDALKRIVEEENRIVYFDHPYSIQNSRTLEMLARLDPQMRAVVIYREPIDAMLSMHNYSRPSYGKRDRGGPQMALSFMEFISDSKFVESMEDGQLNKLYVAEYSYDVNAKNLRDHFTNWQEMLYDSMKNDPDAFLQDFFERTGIPPEYTLPDHPVNRSLSYRSYRLHLVFMKVCLLLTGVETKQFTRAFQEKKMKPSLLRFLMDLNHKDPHFLTPSDIERLRAVTGPMVQRFSKLTDLDLGRWGYPV